VIGATAMVNAKPDTALRPDLALIADMVTDGGVRVLDVGCGDGALLEYLANYKGADARGVELSQAGVNACVSRGLSVVQGDADKDLKDYPSDAFDFVILSQTIQATVNPREVLSEMLRIGRRVIVSFPNFGHWRIRFQLLFNGRMPMTHALDAPWYATPNIHLCTVKDFLIMSKELGVSVERAVTVKATGPSREFKGEASFANLFAEGAVFLLRRSA
jgi:methionine biosynthesis protein MetW